MALEDIIPLDSLLGKSPQYGDEQSGEKEKRSWIGKQWRLP